MESRSDSGDEFVFESRWEAPPVRWHDDQNVGSGNQGGVQGKCLIDSKFIIKPH